MNTLQNTESTHPSSGEWSVADLVASHDNGQPIHVLDVRAPERLASGRIELVPEDRFHNVRGSEVLSQDLSTLRVPKDAPVAVVCGMGQSSRPVADHLRNHGYDAYSLAGGMLAWMALSVPRELAAPSGWDHLIQLDRIGKGALGYVLVSKGEALVVDPSRHLLPVEQALHNAGATLVGVADTHAHADYISGARALAEKHSVPYYLHPADASYPFDGRPADMSYRAVEGGDEIAVGACSVSVLHTPGHTEGSVSYRLGEDAVLTGDFVFIGSVGRPDLGGQADVWTKKLWRSLEQARTDWPDSLVVLPAHYAGNGERNADGSIGKSWGDLPPGNEPLRLSRESDFLDWVMSRVGSFPEAYRRIKAINLGLEDPSTEERDVLEAGRNQCALG